MTLEPLRVALIGYGFAGRTFHAPLIRAAPGMALEVVVSHDPAKVHADLPNAAVVPSVEEAFARADVVVIATPNDSHAPLAMAALEHDKHVVVDKPFTISVEEARRVVSLAERRRLVVSVFQNRRWDGDFLGVQEVLAEGLLGEIVHFESHFDRYRPNLRARWREQRGPGSGLWFDLGPHLIDQALQLFGPPSCVIASLAVQRVGATTDDWAHTILDYGRLRVVLHASVLVAGGSPRFSIHGTNGSWVKRGLDVQESQLVAGLRPGDRGWGDDPIAAQLYIGGDATAGERPVPAGDYRQYYTRLRDAVLGIGPNPVTPEQAIAVMTVLEAAHLSARDGRTVPLA
jgi:predicted dehydrogenase